MEYNMRLTSSHLCSMDRQCTEQVDISYFSGPVQMNRRTLHPAVSRADLGRSTLGQEESRGDGGEMGLANPFLADDRTVDSRP